MKTSYFADKRLDREKHFLIQVSNSAPMNLMPDIKWDEVVPDWKDTVSPYKTHVIGEEEYRKRYIRQLNTRKQSIKHSLSIILSKAGGKEPVLICYESPGAFCHRHILADWLMENCLAQNIRELKEQENPTLF